MEKRIIQFYACLGLFCLGLVLGVQKERKKRLPTIVTVEKPEQLKWAMKNVNAPNGLSVVFAMSGHIDLSEIQQQDSMVVINNWHPPTIVSKRLTRHAKP